MRTRVLNVFIVTTCVSFTLIVLLFSVMSVTTQNIGHTSPRAVLIFLSMCLVISVWTTWLGTRTWKSAVPFYLLAYAGCVGAVLGIGEVTGFIPLVGAEGYFVWTVLAMITGVFVGTAMYRIVRESSQAARINARLQTMRRTGHPQTVVSDERDYTCGTWVGRFSYMVIASYTVLMTAAALLGLFPEPVVNCSPLFAFLAVGVCAAVSCVAAMLQDTSWSSWKVFAVCTVIGAGLSDGIMIPAGVMQPAVGAVLSSVGISALVTACTAGTMLSMDAQEAREINDEIRKRRVDGAKDYPGGESPEKIR